MTDNTRNLLISQLKSELQSRSDLTTLSDDELKKLAVAALENKIDWARTNSPEAYKELSTLNFRERRQITDAIFESIRGLGILGQIICDSDITEVMINGYQNIFIEKSGIFISSKLNQWA